MFIAIAQSRFNWILTFEAKFLGSLHWGWGLPWGFLGASLCKIIGSQTSHYYVYYFHLLIFPELDLPRDVDPENPLSRHPDDCTVYFNGNAPMRCGEGDAFSIELNWCVPYEEADC